MSDRRDVTYRRAASGPRSRPPEPDADGRHLGPLPITATGVLIVLALIGSLAFLAYAVTVRESTQIPLLAAGSVVLGLVFAAIAIVGARATWRSSVGGRDARAFGHAIVGGIAALVAAVCFAGAIVLFLIRGG
jgi:hypothetical protein